MTKVQTTATEGAKDFFKLVSSMRSLQKRYFKTRLKSVLVEAVKKEREVDEYLAELDGNLILKSSIKSH